MKLFPPSLTDTPNGFNSISSGNMYYDSEYFYVKYKGWRRFRLSPVSSLDYNFPFPKNEGDIFTDNEYFYIGYNNQWIRFPCNVFRPNRPIGNDSTVINLKNCKVSSFPSRPDSYGYWGLISFNKEYFCIWGRGKWHKIPIFPMPIER